MVSRLFLSSSPCRWLECFDFSARVSRECERAAGVSAHGAGERARGGEIASGFRSRSSTCEEEERVGLTKITTFFIIIIYEILKTLQLIRTCEENVKYFTVFLLCKNDWLTEH